MKIVTGSVITDVKRGIFLVFSNVTALQRIESYYIRIVEISSVLKFISGSSLK